MGVAHIRQQAVPLALSCAASDYFIQNEHARIFSTADPPPILPWNAVSCKLIRTRFGGRSERTLHNRDSVVTNF